MMYFDVVFKMGFSSALTSLAANHNFGLLCSQTERTKGNLINVSVKLGPVKLKDVCLYFFFFFLSLDFIKCV